METKPSTASISLRHPIGYYATYMVNRFCLQKNSGFTLAHFGLMDDSGKLLDYFGCIFTEHMLSDLRENLVAYSEKIGTAKKKSPTWVPKVEEVHQREGLEGSRFGVVDFIHLTNWLDAYAEICFWNYSKASLSDHLFTKENGAQHFQTWGLALLRCDINLQRELLEALYPA